VFGKHIEAESFPFMLLRRRLRQEFNIFAEPVGQPQVPLQVDPLSGT